MFIHGYCGNGVHCTGAPVQVLVLEVVPCLMAMKASPYGIICSVHISTLNTAEDPGDPLEVHS